MGKLKSILDWMQHMDPNGDWTIEEPADDIAEIVEQTIQEWRDNNGLPEETTRTMLQRLEEARKV